jgi:uncharacterized protein
VARNAPSVDAFGDGGFRLSGQWHAGSVLILRDEALAWPVASLADLGPEALAPVIESGPREVEFLLLGVGRANALPPRAVRDALQTAGIGLEYMDTATAARTYNVLTAEGRRLACGLIAI